MKREKLYNYIVNLRCRCPLCAILQERVRKNGIDEIAQWDNFVCCEIENMQNRYKKIID